MSGPGRRGVVRALLRRDGVHIGVVWLVLGTILARFATHVRDYIDFDSGRYERLAISIARTHSLVPRVNGVDIHSYSQLYPLLIAPFFAHGLVSTDLRHSGIAGAYIMSSACIPAFFLTRLVTPVRWAPYAVGVLTVCMPWIVTALFIMTEVAAYPACTWALFAMVLALTAPSKRRDAFALLTLALAFFARGELIGLAVVFPLALIAFELGRAPGARLRDRALAAGRSLVRGHPLLVLAYGGGGVAALVLYAQHRLASVIGIYGAYSSSAHLEYGRLPRALVGHLASFSLGVGVVPLVLALAWLGANMLRPPRTAAAHAFACVGAVTIVVLFVQATNFDLVVNAYIHDRFLMYLVPVVLVGLVLAVSDARKPRWSLAPPLALVVAGFALGEIPPVTWRDFDWLDLDSPISTIYRVLASDLGGLTPARAGLVVLAVAGTALFALGAARARQRWVAAGVVAFCAVGMVAGTKAIFDRTFREYDRNLRFVSTSQHGTLDWIDLAVGPNASVTAIPYPISSDWFVSEQRWVDFEFFNKSIVRVARLPNLDPFDYFGFWFPKLDLDLDPETGAIGDSPTRWIVGSIKETRFRIAGPATLHGDDALLIDAGKHWRLAWLTSGLYDDGWTKPGVPMELRVYPRAGQRGPEVRTVAMVLRAHASTLHPIVVRSQGRTIHAVVTTGGLTQRLEVCVPTVGYAEVRLTVKGSSEIPGDLASYAETLTPRVGGIFVASLGEADEIGGRCTAPPAT